jgi:hypothetical protein
MQCNAMQCNAMQCNAMQCNAMQCSVLKKQPFNLDDFVVVFMSRIAILLQRPVYCFWRADFHGQGATLVTPDNLMYSLPTISP